MFGLKTPVSDWNTSFLNLIYFMVTLSYEILYNNKIIIFFFLKVQ